MVDFADHFTIHAIKTGFQKYYSLPRKCACQSKRSPRYFHLNRISDLFAIHCSSSHAVLARFRVSLVVRKKLLHEKLNNRSFFLKMQVSCPKLSSAHQRLTSKPTLM